MSGIQTVHNASDKLPRSKKNAQWGKDKIDYYERLSYMDTFGNRATNYRKAVNYDLFNGRFNKRDFEYVTNPLGIRENEFPANLQHYDIITESLRFLIGEEMTKPDINRVVASDPDALNEFSKQKEDIIMKVLNMQLQQAVRGQETDNDGDENNGQPQTPEEVEQWMKYNYKDVREIIANNTLAYLKRDLKTNITFNKGWKDALIAGEEIYWVGIINGEPALRRVNPLDIAFVMDADADFFDECTAAVEVRRLTPATIIDEWGDELTPDEIDKIEEMAKGASSGAATSQAFSSDMYMGIPQPLVLPQSTGQFPETSNTLAGRYGRYPMYNIRVVRCEWSSLREIGFLTYLDPETNKQETIQVDESYKIDKEDPNTSIEYTWINEWWEGTKIGQDIYVGIAPKKNQRRRMDNPYHSKSGYVGHNYEATNSIGVSLLDRVKAYQYLYNVIMYRTELAFASDMGKVFLMDIAQIPTSEGWDVEKWMYYLKAMKIGFVNSFEEGKGRFQGQKPTFNQFQSVDLTMGNYIQQNVEFLGFIEKKVEQIIGIPNQRLGQIEPSELVGNTNAAITQSSHITEYYYSRHQEVKRRAYEALIEAAKLAWKDSKKIKYITDEMTVNFFEIDGPLFENSEYDVFVSNSSKDARNIQIIQQLASEAIKADKMSFSNLAKTLTTEDLAKITKILEEGEQMKLQQDQQASQAQMSHEKELQTQQLQEAAANREMSKYIADTNNERAIQVAEINAATQEKINLIDVQPGDETDPLDISKHILEKNKHEADINIKKLGLKQQDKKLETEKDKSNNDLKIEKLKVEHEKSEKAKDRLHERQLKEKELASKEKIAKMKPKPTTKKK